ncbi:copper amine oxidase N-terminal domain-containing protein [Paenibacillus sp. WQ 127069]|uniref:Copper amine oxidase N-terminal domain-containing protein n=1 Tax=Paenibacillus baimaensis TaxID=2982185 RepID=A0ABT2UGM8_9BACL|nr:copper amine oxidase N-terminal domain-containing protein [Paenibacillus sp. WQ 127069]MCU6793784.1 copper amine oxidase N-terminal domain-containing protein [Paenibacillus sp. WQ 127069]
MRKYAIGFVVGAILAGATAVYADNAINAVLFPAKYEVNGEAKQLPDGYSTINVDGHAYVPIRFIAESLGAVVAYDHDSTTIQVDNNFHVTNMNSGIRAGHLQVTKTAEGSAVEGKLFVGQDHWEAMANSRKSGIAPGSDVTVTGDLLFYDDQGKYIGKVPIQAAFVAKGDQIRDFKATADRDVTGYAFASLANVGPVPMGLPVPPTVDVYDSSNRLGVGDFRMAAQDGFTKIRGWVSLKQTGNYRYDATLNFYDAAGKALGTAELKQTGSGSAESFTATTFETAGKGDFTGYKSVSVTVNTFEPTSDPSK